MSWTEEQKSVIKCTDPLIVVNACAGSGKTATLLGIMKKNPTKKILYIVFNTSMKDEASEKVKKYGFHHVDIKTSHSLAYKHFGRMNEIGNVSYLNVAEAFSWGDSPQRRGYLRILYSYYKKYLQSSYLSIIEFCESIKDEMVPKLKTYIKNASLEEAIKNFDKIWQGMEKGQIKMTHDYYLKYFALSSKVENSYDIVLLDEAQDTNEIMLNIMEKKFPKARKIIVGDHNQAIYAWRGAINAMDFFSKLPNSTKLALTNSFRVGENTANLANFVINSKKDLNSNMKGLNVKQDIITKEFSEKKAFTYLARTNATLFEYGVNNMNKKLYFNNNVSFKILEEVFQLFKGNIRAVEDPRLKLFSTFDSLKYHVEEDGVEEAEIKIAVNVVDKYKDETIIHLNELKKNLASKETCDVILSTVHASKGLEYERVLLADDFIDIEKISEKLTFLENKFSELGDNEKGKKVKDKHKDLFNWFKEECNILYVAITRSFGELQVNKSLKKIYK